MQGGSGSPDPLASSQLPRVLQVGKPVPRGLRGYKQQLAGLHPGLQLPPLAVSTWNGQGWPGRGSVRGGCLAVFRLRREMCLRGVGLKGNKAHLHLSLEKVNVQVGEVYKATDQAALGQLMTFPALAAPELLPQDILHLGPQSLGLCSPISPPSSISCRVPSYHHLEAWSTPLASTSGDTVSSADSTSFLFLPSFLAFLLADGGGFTLGCRPFCPQTLLPRVPEPLLSLAPLQACCLEMLPVHSQSACPGWPVPALVHLTALSTQTRDVPSCFLQPDHRLCPSGPSLTLPSSPGFPGPPWTPEQHIGLELCAPRTYRVPACGGCS